MSGTPGLGRRGRRPAGQDTREQVLSAARAEFLENGYDAVSLRGVARRAGVDPGTVRHWFGDKTHLFTATLGVADVDPAAVVRATLEGPLDGLGERLVRGVVELWDTDSGNTVRLVLPAVMSDPGLRALVPQFLGAELLGPIVRRLGVSDGPLRTSLVASQMGGMLLTRYLVPVQPLASLSPAEVAQLVGPNVQRYLTADLRQGVVSGSAEEENSPHGE
jgi:AcrR family transcriptional regulator